MFTLGSYSLSIESFTLFIQQQVHPYKDSLDLYIDGLMNDPAMKLKKTDIKADDIAKFKRYLEYFILVVE